MKFTITHTKSSTQIPSGSGIVKSGHNYYVIGDDSPFLFTLNEQLEVISKTLIISSEGIVGNRIPKPIKPDFESIEIIEEKELVVFGSGSKSPHRDVLIHILVEGPMVITQYSLTAFYAELRRLPELQDSELNIEASAFHSNQLYLFNRNKNVIFKFDYCAFSAYIRGEGSFPKPEIKQFTLPEINGIEAGFSGATILKSQAKIIFTASVEDTDNAYDDGEILGSIIGMIDVSNDTIADSYSACLIPNGTENYKVESITIEEEISSETVKVVMITDDDKGNSILLKGLLSW
ncbi:MAG TPA: hypothetical protein VKY37_03385 [Brumimicrobium sp.]|nr:hypothetical protein [Brumimicrobium sp.]